MRSKEFAAPYFAKATEVQSKEKFDKINDIIQAIWMSSQLSKASRFL